MVDLNRIPQNSPLSRSVIPDEQLRIPDYQGGGAQFLGKQISAFGDAAASFANEYKKETLRFENYQARTEFEIFKRNEQQRLLLESRTAPPGAPNFSQTFIDRHIQNADGFQSRIPPSALPQMAPHIAAFRGALENLALKAELDNRTAYTNDTLDANLNNMLTDAQSDPSRLPELLRNAEDLIAQSTLPTTDKIIRFRNAKANLQIAFAQGEINRNPTEVIAALGQSRRVNNPVQANVISRIRSEATAQGLNPDVVAGIAYIENPKFDPNARTQSGVNSFVLGLFQNIQSSRDQYGITNDIQTQITGGTRDIKDKLADLSKRLGTNLTPGMSYLAHFQGPQGAEAILKGDPNASVLDTLAAAVSPQHAATVGRFNPMLRNMTNLQLRAWAEQRMNNAINSTGGVINNDVPVVDPRYSEIPFTQRTTLQQRATQQAERQENEQAVLSTSSDTINSENLFRQGLMIDFKPPKEGDQTLEQFINNNSQNLKPDHLRTLIALASREDNATRDNQDVYIDLTNAALDPQTAQQTVERAAQAFRDGQILKSSYKEIRKLASDTLNQSGESRADISRHFTLAMRQVKERLTDPKFGFGENPLTVEIRQVTQRAFSEWFAANRKDMSTSSISEEANRLVSNASERLTMEKQSAADQTFVRSLLGVSSQTDAIKAIAQPNTAIKAWEELDRKLKRRQVTPEAFARYVDELRKLEFLSWRTNKLMTP